MDSILLKVKAQGILLLLLKNKKYLGKISFYMSSFG